MKNLSLLVLVLIAGCTTASHKVTATPQPVVAWDKVGVYYSMPPNAKVIGAIHADSMNELTQQPTTGDALDNLKKEAAQLGANGIVVNPSDENYLRNKELDGEAIFIGTPMP